MPGGSRRSKNKPNRLKANYAFCDDISSRGKKLETNTDAKMESHPKLATAENNLYNASYYIIQKRKIAQRYARQSKTLEAHVPPPQPVYSVVYDLFYR